MNTPQFDLGAMLSAPQTAIQQIPCDQLNDHMIYTHTITLETSEGAETTEEQDNDE